MRKKKREMFLSVDLSIASLLCPLSWSCSGQNPFLNALFEKRRETCLLSFLEASFYSSWCLLLLVRFVMMTMMMMTILTVFFLLSLLISSVYVISSVPSSVFVMLSLVYPSDHLWRFCLVSPRVSLCLSSLFISLVSPRVSPHVFLCHSIFLSGSSSPGNITITQMRCRHQVTDPSTVWHPFCRNLIQIWLGLLSLPKKCLNHPNKDSLRDSFQEHRVFWIEKNYVRLSVSLSFFSHSFYLFSSFYKLCFFSSVYSFNLLRLLVSVSWRDFISCLSLSFSFSFSSFFSWLILMKMTLSSSLFNSLQLMWDFSSLSLLIDFVC